MSVDLTKRPRPEEEDDEIASAPAAKLPRSVSAHRPRWVNIYFIRHGETDWNILQGHYGLKPVTGAVALSVEEAERARVADSLLSMDAPLNDLGKRQAFETGAWFRQQGIQIDLLIASPHWRTLQTAICVFGQNPSGSEDLSQFVVHLPSVVLPDARELSSRPTGRPCSDIRAEFVKNFTHGESVFHRVPENWHHHGRVEPSLLCPVAPERVSARKDSSPEDDQIMWGRIERFRQFLVQMLVQPHPPATIAIVGHGRNLLWLLGEQHEMFMNGEVRLLEDAIGFLSQPLHQRDTPSVLRKCFVPSAQ